MEKMNHSAPIHLIVYFAVFCLFFSNSNAQQYNLRVPTPNCKLIQIENCFNDVARANNFEVGREVTLLSDLYTFCTSVSIVYKGTPARIVLVLDHSQSMCSEVNPNCPGSTNNDPDDKRVYAALAFVDSVRNKCGNCQIGVVIYEGVGTSAPDRTVQEVVEPLQLNNDANVSTIKRAIVEGACNPRDFAGMVKRQDVKNLAKIKKTYTGFALDSALSVVDVNYDSTMERHIILLTDGDWQTPLTPDIFAAYHQTYPGRPLPIIHGVFISDTVTHIANGYPAHGLLECTTDSPQVQIPYDLKPLEQAADSTHGKYFPGSSPQTIVATFDTLFRTIVDTNIVGLESVTFTKTTGPKGGEQRVADFKLKDPTKPDEYTVSVPAYDLDFGINTFIITMVLRDTGNVRITQYDTFSVNRLNTSGTASTNVFKTECFIDTVLLSITCKPGSLLVSQLDTVSAKVEPTSAEKFVPNNVLLRVITPFPDEGGQTLALFHLDNNIANSISGGPTATGTPTLSNSNAAFGFSMTGGSFAIGALPVPITGDFTVECWVRLTASSQGGAIISGSDFSLGVNANGYLTATMGSTTITGAYIMDKDVWQHIAIARVGGKANLYINGIPKDNEEAVTAAGGISGVLTVTAPSGVWVDEVRVSSAVKGAAIMGRFVLQLPYAENLMWKINTTTTTNISAILPGDAWQGTPRGQTQFQFSNMLPGSSIINFFDTMASQQIIWSKNGDPVVFTTNGVPVTAIFMDTSHNGSLDRIDLKWIGDDIQLKTLLPGVHEFITALHIITTDNKTDSLNAVTIVADPATKTLHVILQENKGVLETDWNSAVMMLSNFPVTKDGKPFYVAKIVDGAAPIPVYACYSPGQNYDTLKVTFSENVIEDSANVNVESFLRVLVKDTAFKNPFQSYNPAMIKVDERVFFIFTYNSAKDHDIYAYDYRVQERFPSGPNSPQVNIEFCTTVRMIEKPRVYPNPTFAGKEIKNGPWLRYPNRDDPVQLTGSVKIDVLLSRNIDGPDGKPEIQGWLTIFDAVGNVVLENVPFGKETQVKLSMGWDLRNKNKSRVAGGTYLGRIVVKDILNNIVKREETASVKIGIKTVKE